TKNRIVNSRRTQANAGSRDRDADRLHVKHRPASNVSRLPAVGTKAALGAIRKGAEIREVAAPFALRTLANEVVVAPTTTTLAAHSALRLFRRARPFRP